MPREYVFPDTNGRSKNNPCTIADNKKCLEFIIKNTMRKKICRNSPKKSKNGLKPRRMKQDGMMQGFLAGNAF